MTRKDMLELLEVAEQDFHHGYGGYAFEKVLKVVRAIINEECKDRCPLLKEAVISELDNLSQGAKFAGVKNPVTDAIEKRIHDLSIPQT